MNRPPLTLIEMTDCKLAWTADGLRRLDLPHDHTRTLYGVWRDQQLLFATSAYADALLHAEFVAAEDDSPIVDMAGGFMRLSIMDEWEHLPPPAAL